MWGKKGSKNRRLLHLAASAYFDIRFSVLKAIIVQLIKGCWCRQPSSPSSGWQSEKKSGK